MKSCFTLLLILIHCQISVAKEAIDQDKASRAADLAAIASYRVAANRLIELAAKKKNVVSPEEAALQIRILETLNRMVSIQFRLAFAPTENANTNPLQEYKATLNSIIQRTSIFLKKYPRAPDVARSVFLRAKAYRELERDQDAIRDFRYLIDYFPKNADRMNAEFSLYDLLVKNNDYKTALSYMLKVETNPKDNYYPLIQDHIAFSYYYLNEVPLALQYLLKELAIYPVENTSKQIEKGDREKILSNCVLFYFTGFDKKIPNYTIQGALPFLKSLNASGSFGKILAYFANLLRSKNYDDALDYYKTAAVSDNIDRNDIVGLLLIVLERDLGKNAYARLRETSQYLFDIVNKDGVKKTGSQYEKMQKILSDTVATLQARLGKLKDTNDGQQLAAILILLDNILLKTTPHSLASLKIRFNLAETLYSIRDYNAAVLQYRWLAENGSSIAKNNDLVELSKYKAVTARYETFHLRNLFPKELKPQAFPTVKPAATTPDIEQWISWLDQTSSKDNFDTLETLNFEANRLLYSQGQISESLDRLLKRLRNNAASKYAIPSASLIIDTYVASEKWNDLLNLGKEFLILFKDDKSNFTKQVQEIIYTCYLKTTEDLYKQKKYPEVFASVDTYLRTQSHQHHIAHDLMALAANTALAVNNKRLAITYFSLLNQVNAKPDLNGLSLITSGSFYEEQYDYTSATYEYLKFFKLPNYQKSIEPVGLKSLKEKLLLIAWLSGKGAPLKDTVNSNVVCDAESRDSCENYRVLAGFFDPTRSTDRAFTKRAHDNSRKGTLPRRAIWATLALENPKATYLYDKLELLNTVIEGWSKENSLVQYSLLAHLSDSLPKTLKQMNLDIHSASHLGLEKDKIDRRVKMIEKVENTLQKLSDLPWAKLRLTALNQWANLYSDFSSEILALPKPAGLTPEDLKVYDQTVDGLRAPFAKKANELRQKALDLAIEAGVEGSVYEEIVTAYNKENPQQPQTPSLTRLPALPASSALMADPSLFNQLKAPQEWTRSIVESAKEQNWGKLAFMLQEAHEKQLMAEPLQTFARAASLWLAGAQAEGINELSDNNLQQLPSELKSIAIGALIQGFYGARNLEKTKKYIPLFSELKNLTPAQANEISRAIAWSGIPVSSSLQNSLNAKSQTSPAAQTSALPTLNPSSLNSSSQEKKL